MDNFMKKKLLVLLLIIMASINTMMAQNPQDENLIVMNEKVVNPTGEHGGTPKSPNLYLYVYWYGNTLDFGMSLSGCPVQLLQDDNVVFSTLVGTDGTVVLPTNLSGLYELQITVQTITYIAELTFTDE